MNSDLPTWVFGYGSLIWRQDFPFLESRACYIKGWERRFWQGSHDHRGVPDSPGRVVTLITTPGATCHGRAFLIKPDVFDHLDHREKNGYERFDQEIFFSDCRAPGVVYIAPINNHAFLGEASIKDIAAQIGQSEGPSGHNQEYLLELAQSLRAMGVDDPHVFDLERVIKRKEGGQA